MHLVHMSVDDPVLYTIYKSAIKLSSSFCRYKMYSVNLKCPNYSVTAIFRMRGKYVLENRGTRPRKSHAGKARPEIKF
jgi:hypothetical protein